MSNELLHGFMNLCHNINKHDRAQKLLAIRPNLRIRNEKTRKVKKTGTFPQVMNQNTNIIVFQQYYFCKYRKFRLIAQEKRTDFSQLFHIDCCFFSTF